jgi:hypothetical protein
MALLFDKAFLLDSFRTSGRPLELFNLLAILTDPFRTPFASCTGKLKVSYTMSSNDPRKAIAPPVIGSMDDRRYDILGAEVYAEAS